MRMLSCRILLLVWISGLSGLLTGCNTVGNVVPQNGPRMEQVYDSMQHSSAIPVNKQTSAQRIEDFRTRHLYSPAFYAASGGRVNNVATIPASATYREFKKVPNPELTLYIFPHLASADQVPVPGYSTVFDAYDRDHFMLANAVER